MNEPQEVYFDEYCCTCEYGERDECKDPCNECLDYPVNIDSHKPVYWKEKEVN